MERYRPKMYANAITYPRSASRRERANGAALAIRPIISFTFANCESRRRSAICEREREQDVATPLVLCISSIHVAVSGTDPRRGAPLCTEAIRQSCEAGSDRVSRSPSAGCQESRTSGNQLQSMTERSVRCSKLISRIYARNTQEEATLEREEEEERRKE
ncbi:uncharacterized protein LOC105286297 [Ooceraea biroi]|uniref:uncharacterized protein LOC105286297 n=1 Tax=Ooceraea biroi TaxID=2015173 RepID=UPI0009717027|nr:uncharacterized protein LOC105286297 [Ooceraea biroi]